MILLIEMKQLNDQQRIFAQAIVDGLDGVDAYQKAFPKCARSSASAAATRLMKVPRVAAEIDRLRTQSEQDCRMDRKKILAYLCDVVETPPGKIDEMSPLCQSYKETRTGCEFRMPGKLEAIERMCRMMGWDKAQKVEVALDPVASILAKIRAGGSQ